MKAILQLVAALSFASFSLSSAAISIFACEPEWSALAQELGGDKVSVYSATTALQDPHRIEARPSLIARVRSADLLVCTGAELEIGWLPLLLTQSGNSRIQLGSPGYFEASQYVPKIEVPATIDRSLGDVHASGNPHIHLDPRNVAKVADALAERLNQLDPANARYVLSVIDRAIDGGITMIDVADVYAGGESEKIVGGALAANGQLQKLADPIGRLDGLYELADRSLLFTDWNTGSLSHWSAKGGVKKIADGFKGPADFAVIPGKAGPTVVVPDLVQSQLRFIQLTNK